ncbi:unnamed protein product [Plutella xylostella]|uniref:(diamondback moth) hypothetical protein n=1 Tax=Plutella xylostella TaxID=51655 RepID=A0A8S4FDH4_PLUXY|nr:unnamed protein product [Plutella xylostella]
MVKEQDSKKKRGLAQRRNKQAPPTFARDTRKTSPKSFPHTCRTRGLGKNVPPPAPPRRTRGGGPAPEDFVCAATPGRKLFYPYLKTSSLHRDFLFASGSDESGCEADMSEGAEGARRSPPRSQHEPINLKNERGVRQGCILSPKLFNIYGEHIVRAALEGWEGGLSIGGRKINNLRYADDTTLVATSEEEMAVLFDRIEGESAKLGLRINKTKTKLLTVDRETRTPPRTSSDQLQSPQHVRPRKRLQLSRISHH